MRTIGGLSTSIIDDPKKIIKEINSAKKNKKYDKLTGLYNILAQRLKNEGSVEALEKATKYHAYCSPLDAINTFLNKAELYGDNERAVLQHLDFAQTYLDKLNTVDKVEKIIDLCEIYMRIPSPQPVLELTRIVKRADDKNMFSILLLKVKALRQLNRCQDAMEVITDMTNIKSLQHSAKYKCILLGEMAKVQNELGNFETESKLKAQYFELKKNEELQLSDESLSDMEVLPTVISHFDISARIYHKCPFLQVDTLNVNISNELSRTQVQNEILKSLRLSLKIPNLLIKQFKFPKNLSSLCVVDVWLSNSSLPKLSSLYNSTVSVINQQFSLHLDKIDFSSNSFFFDHLQLTDSDFNFIQEYLSKDIDMLHLQHNFLTGAILPRLSEFPNLRELDISNNCLYGQMSFKAISNNVSCWDDANISSISDRVVHLTMALAFFKNPSALDALAHTKVVRLSLRESKFTEDAYFSLIHNLKEMQFLKDLDLSGLEAPKPICLTSIPCSVTNLQLDLTFFTDDCDFNFELPNLSILSLRASEFLGKSGFSFSTHLIKYPVRRFMLQDTLIPEECIKLLETKMLVVR